MESGMLYEDAVLEYALALPSRSREDEKHEVYFFWPSSPESRVLLSGRLAQGEPAETSSPTLYHSSEDIEDEDGASVYPSVYRPSVDSHDGIQPSSVIPPPSPAYSISNHIFTQREQETEMKAAGYSRVFTAGLALESRRVTGRIGGFYRDLRRVFAWSSWLGPP